jgi:7-carboxy-7-deazaguanine synthase
MTDWEYAKTIIAKYGLTDRTNAVLISPVHGMPEIVDLAEAVSRSGLKVRLNLQLHKYIWGADSRGV